MHQWVCACFFCLWYLLPFNLSLLSTPHFPSPSSLPSFSSIPTLPSPCPLSLPPAISSSSPPYSALTHPYLILPHPSLFHLSSSCPSLPPPFLSLLSPSHPNPYNEPVNKFMKSKAMTMMGCMVILNLLLSVFTATVHASVFLVFLGFMVDFKSVLAFVVPGICFLWIVPFQTIPKAPSPSFPCNSIWLNVISKS